MGIFDAMKLPDLSAIGERLTNFINAASLKMDGQTAAIKMLAEQVKVQNGLLYDIKRNLENGLHYQPNYINGSVLRGDDSGRSIDMGDHGPAAEEPDGPSN